MRQEAAAFHAVLVHGDGHRRELFRHLQGLVAELQGRSVPPDLLEPFRLALVSARKHGDVGIGPFIAPQQQAEDHLRMRGFSGTAYGDIAYADGGNISLV